MIETNKAHERAILVGIVYPGQDECEVEDFLKELEFLTETAGADPIKRFVQKLDMPNPRTFIGSGKIKEIAAFIEENNIDIAIFDDELFTSPTAAREVFDVTGAGDTVIASITFALSCGVDIKKALYFANLAAGVVVGKIGSATASLDEIYEYESQLNKSSSSSHIKTFDEIEKLIVWAENYQPEVDESIDRGEQE